MGSASSTLGSAHPERTNPATAKIETVFMVLIMDLLILLGCPV
jgi:hypothetical protein